MMELTAGAVLSETYELIDLLGRGGMGEVWRGKHRRLPKEVAIKILTPSAQSSPEAVTRFHREAEISSKLGHPNIVEILDYNTLPDGRAYIVMELLVGEDLRHRLGRGPVPFNEALEILYQVAAALFVAHNAGVVHRDLKPENIFLFRKQGALSSELCVKVLDFGISKIQGSQTLVTRDHDVIGTPAYMSPEQATGKNREVDAHTDQFALAAIGYELFSGKCPFAGETLAEVVHRVVYEEVPPLEQLKPDLPQQITASINRGMAKRSDQRFSDVAAFIRSLTAGLGEPGHGSGLGLSADPGPSGEATIQPTGLAPGRSVTPGGVGQAAASGLEATLDPSNPGLEPTMTPLGSSNPGLEPTMTPLGPTPAPAAPQVHTPGSSSAPTGTPATPGLGTTLAPWETGPAGQRTHPSRQEPPAPATGQTIEGIGPQASGGTSRAARTSVPLTTVLVGFAAVVVVGFLAVYLIQREAPRTPPAVAGNPAVAPAVDAAPVARAAVDAAVADQATPAAAIQARVEARADAAPRAPDGRVASAAPKRPRAGRHPPATKEGSTRRPVPKKQLSPEAAELLRRAQKALDQERFGQAVSLGRQSLMVQRDQHEAYFMMAKGYCGQRDLGNVNTMLRRLPRSYHRQVWKFCARFGVQKP